MSATHFRLQQIGESSSNHSSGYVGISDPTPFNHLPDHVLQHILSFLGFSDLCRMALVSRKAYANVSSLRIHRLHTNEGRVSSLKFSPNGLKFFLRKNGKELLYLTLEDETPENVLKTIGCCPNLIQLCIQGCKMYRTGARAISTITQELTSLNLSGNSIGDLGAKAISKRRGIIRLNLHNNFIGVKGARPISSMQSVTNLDLSFNSLRDEGAKVIATMQSVITLNLSFNSIRNAGAKEISHMQSVQILNLSFNSIGDEGVQALANMLKVIRLNLRDNPIHNAGLQAIASMRARGVEV